MTYQFEVGFFLKRCRGGDRCSYTRCGPIFEISTLSVRACKIKINFFYEDYF